jgi:hypothetical protein
MTNDFMNYLYLSKRIFPQQWEFLATACGIYSRDTDNPTGLQVTSDIHGSAQPATAC